MKAFVRTALVMAALGLGAAMAALPTPSLGARAIPNDADVAEFTIMGHRFRIPKVYLSESHKIVERTPEYEGDSVLMKAALPDLVPITERDTEYYKWGEGFTDVVTFHISAEPGHAGPDEDYFKEENLRKCGGPREGYLVCPHLTSVLATFEVLVRIEGRHRLAFECDKEGTHINDTCVIKLPLLDDIELYIRFSRKHFGDADRLLARIYDLVCSFLVAGPARELTVNLCQRSPQ
ncbi:MAG: hypothetical protein ACE1Y3_06710 [Rhodospirillales bacterium]